MILRNNLQRIATTCLCSTVVIPSKRARLSVVRDGNERARSNAYIAGSVAAVGMDIFTRGLCLPSDNKMTAEQQDRIIEVIRSCFE